MKSDLRIALVQTKLTWENPEANRGHISQLLSAISACDVIILPEMFTTGFSMNAQNIAEDFHTEMVTLQWMRTMAARHNAVITGSVSVKENEEYFNRLLWVRPDGSFSHYDKRHTFSMAGEDKHYKRGGEVLIEEWRGWNIRPLICYDLRFPVWSRNRKFLGEASFDMLLYVANWPEVRNSIWKKLLPARAIENQAYTVGCNMVGNDGNGHVYSGDSVILDPRGEALIKAEPGEEVVLQFSLSANDLKSFREKFPVLDDADDFSLHA